MRELIFSAIQTPDGTVLESNSRHDYRTYTDSISKEEYMIDGGLDYFRTSINTMPPKRIALYSDDEHSELRKWITWGTYGKDGGDELKHIALCDMDDEHIMTILESYESFIAPWRCTLYENELKYRGFMFDEITEAWKRE